ncbi:hypothetical protein MVEN_00689200 [Mycena venus]|uniref:Uncharacterized protein n=1 Tax=Mycena venus TaxID=2733690 RepID=A0A8H7D5H2_9AGAR|nr:hypothetical protein MVEN_00689200 [Mycena venus]
MRTWNNSRNLNLESDQALDPEFAIPIRRLNAVFGAPGLIMTVFANGTTKQATKRIISSFFMNQTFPENCIAPAPAPFNISSGCANYWDTLVNAVPGTLADVTGIFKQNVDLLNGILFNASGCAEPLAPAGPTNV